MADKPKRKVIAGPFGLRGRMVTVKVVRGRARVHWRQNGKDTTRWFANTPTGRAEAKAFAQGVYAELSAAPVAASAPATLRQLWEKYATAEFDHLRTKSKRNYTAHWQLFEQYAGRDKIANDVDADYLDLYKAELLKRKVAPSQIREGFKTIRRVFRMGVLRKWIAPTTVTEYRYKVGKDVKLAEIPEYAPEEQERLRVQFDPRSAVQWRAYVMTEILAFMGPRANALGFLDWPEVDLENLTIKWRPELSKTGEEYIQPMPAPIAEGLYVAYGWAVAYGYTGPHVFFGAQARTRDVKPYTYSAYIRHLRAAEIRAGVPYIPYRGAHGFRKGAAGNVWELTGDPIQALRWIGDKFDKKRIDEYLKTRDGSQRRVAALLGGEK